MVFRGFMSDRQDRCETWVRRGRDVLEARRVLETLLGLARF